MNQSASTGCCGESGPDETRLERIHEYLNGALSWEDLLQLQDHLASCPQCAADFDLECIIRSVVSRSCHETAPEGLRSRIRLRIDEIRVTEGH